jgi:hypothetical protein
MLSRKKSSNVLSALTMAAAAAASAQTAHAVSLTMYYGAENSYANSNNGIFIAPSYGFTGTQNAQSENQFLSGFVQSITPVAGGPTTIVVPIGDYLSISLDAVLTGNINAAAGTRQQGDGFTQPTFLGLSSLGLTISSSDLTGTKLTPISTATAPATTIAGLPNYLSTAIINEIQGSNGGGGNPAIGDGPAPSWLSSFTEGGDVAPNMPGYDTSPNSSGGVGLGSTVPASGAFPFGGQTSADGSSTGNFGTKPTSQAEGLLKQFAAFNNTPSYANATDFLDSLTFKAISNGIVTLTPSVIRSATQYWRNNGTQPVNNLTTTTYQPNTLGTGDTVNNAPTLVIDIGEILTHPIVNYAGAPDSRYAPSLGLLTVGGNGGMSVSSLSLPPSTNVGTVEAKTFVPASADQIYAVDVLVNGTQASATQLATLMTAINSGDTSVLASAGVTATTNGPVPNPFTSAGTYNLYLDPSGFSDAFLGLDLSSSNDSNLVGYSFSAVAVVPEPMTFGLMALGAVGLLSRRYRPKARAFAKT